MNKNKITEMDPSLVRKICELVLACIVLAALCVTVYGSVIKPSNDVAIIAENITEGTVTKCTQKDNYTYLLYVSAPYIYGGKEYEIHKRYSVPEDTWSKYAVGDTFDASEERYHSCSIDVSSPWDIDRIF